MTADELRKTFSENIKKFRKLYGLTQMALAEKADLSVGYLCDLEAGNKWPTPETITRLASALNAKPFQLFQAEERPSKDSLPQDLLRFSSKIKKNIDSEIHLLLKKYS